MSSAISKGKMKLKRNSKKNIPAALQREKLSSETGKLKKVLRKSPTFRREVLVIRSASSGDYSSLRKLALKYPLLNLPCSPALLKEKIRISESSFAGALSREKTNFLFVLKKMRKEETLEEKGELIGSAQISGKSGTLQKPSYSLKIFKGQKKSSAFLQLRIIRDGPSYLGGLIVAGEYRGHPEKAGKQISLIRFLFCAMHPEFFEDTLHAEVAPFLDEKGQNPFFKYFIEPRFSLSMEEIDYLTLTDKEKLFAEYPRERILFSSLPPSVRECLGKPGFFNRRAAGILSQQKFSFINEVDPFDGGPYMQARVKEIPLVKNTKKVFLKCFSEKELVHSQTKKWLWGRMEKTRFIGGVLEGVLRKNRLFVSKAVPSVFRLKEGELLFVSPFIRERVGGAS